MSTVAVSAPENGMPVPGVDRMPGLTTTMYAIVKNVVTPPARSPYFEARQAEADTAGYCPPSAGPEFLVRTRTRIYTR